MIVAIVRASTIATTLAAVAIGFCAPISAQQYGTAGDISDFANALNDAKYSDIAKEVVTNAITNGVQDQEGVLASALCEISATEAIRTSDIVSRIAKLKEAVSAYESYLKKFPSGEKAAMARLKLSEWLRTAGEICAAQIKKETTPEKKEALKSDGLNFFTKAEVLAKARVEELARTPKDKMTELQQAELFALKFAVARMPYSKALLYENRSGVEAGQLLNEALNLLEELDLDLPPGSILTFETRRIIALIQVEQNKLKDAEETLEYSCNTLAEAAASDPSIVKDNPDNEETRELFARMFLEKVDFLTKTKKPPDWKGALDSSEKLLKLIPDIVKTKDGKQVLITLAEAYRQEDDIKKARAIAQQVYDHDSSGDAGLKARQLLDDLGISGGSDAASMVKLLQGCVERGDIPQGEKMAARILTSAEVKTKPEIQADTLLQLGGLYFNKGLYSYAAVVFSAVAEEFAASPRAPEAKFNEAMSYAKQSQLDGRQAAKYWKEKSKAARSDLIARFGASKEAADVSWFVAEELKLDEKLPEALDLYLKVPATSNRYGDAQYEAGFIAFSLGEQARLRNKPDEVAKNFQKAEGAFKGAITSLETSIKNTINPSELSRLKESLFGARMRLAGLYIQKEKEIHKPKDAEKLLDEVEAGNKEDKNKLGRIWSLRIKALTAQGRGREAVDILLKQADIATPETFINVGGQMDQEAREKMRVNDKDPTINEDLKTAATLYGLAVDKAGAATAQKLDFGIVGLRLLSIGARLSGLGDDISLMALDPTLPISEKQTIERARKAFELAGAANEVDLDRARALAFASAAAGNWLDAVSALKDVADKAPLFTAKFTLNKESLDKYPRLPDIYQDLAVAYIRAAKGEKAHYESAKAILVPLIRNSEPTSKRYWEARYLHLLALKDGQDFKELNATLDALNRVAPDADKNKYGIKTKIDEIRAFAEKIVIK